MAPSVEIFHSWGMCELDCFKQSSLTSRIRVWFCCKPARSLPLLSTRTSVFAEAIAEAAHGLDRIAGFPEFFAQAPYMRVHGAGVDHGFVTPDVVKQFIAVLHAPAALD